MIRFIDLFAGIGGFHLGLTQASNKFKCVYANEWDRYANKIYTQHFGQCDDRDIQTVDESQIPEHDLLVGGFPCQSFSIAGKRQGFYDTRGTMFFEIARIIKKRQPRYLLLENVKGLLSHDEGRTFTTIICTLDELGYDLQWQVLNSKDFGVPQNRERVFIVGHIRGQPRPEIFPITESIYLSEASESKAEQTIANTLRAKQGGPGIDQTYVSRFPLKFAQRNQNTISGDYAFTVDGANTGGVLISKTVRAGGGGSPHGSKQNWDSYDFDGVIRRLTPLECERLQGFPDGWTQGISDTQRYKCLGNAVTVNVVRYLASKLSLNL